jgi:probable HAF family extracellular repeat protein
MEDVPMNRLAGARPTSTLRLLATALALVAACGDSPEPLAPIVPLDTAVPADARGTGVKSVVGLDPLVYASYNYSVANDVSDGGITVGVSSTFDGTSRAVLWEGPGFPVDLGTLPGGSYSQANAINSTGTVIVGWSYISATSQTTAVRWTRQESGYWLIQDIGLPADAVNGVATDVNDGGAIVGYSNTPSGGSQGWIWQNGAFRALGDDGLYQANAINNDNVVAGMSYAFRAAMWTATAGATELGTVGVSSSAANDINDRGAITGNAGPQGFLYTERRGMEDIGSLGGSYTNALGISPTSQVVGISSVPDNTTQHAILSERGRVVDLGLLAGYEGGYSAASAMNANGQIVGYSSSAAGTRATMWTLK